MEKCIGSVIHLKAIRANKQGCSTYSAPLSELKQQLVSLRALRSPPFPSYKIIWVEIAKTDNFPLEV